jgi:hypothetical protein
MGGVTSTLGGADAGGTASTRAGAGGESGTAVRGGAGGGSGSSALAGSAGTSGGSGGASAGAGASGSAAASGGAGVSGGSGGTAGGGASGGSSSGSGGTWWGGGGMFGGAGSAGFSGGWSGPVVQLTGTASASSWENDLGPGGGVHPPRDANDGDAVTRWCAATQSVPQWWQLDLGASHALSRVEIVWEYPGQAMGHVYGYTVGVSDDAAQFPDAPVIDDTANQSTAKTQITAFPAQTAGRYVRITVTSLPPDTSDVPPLETWPSIDEVRVFGH